MKHEVDDKADDLIRKLSSRAEQLNNKLNGFKLICYYCGIRINNGIVNEECEMNK